MEHLGTEIMLANPLAKLVQVAQFQHERRGLTKWELISRFLGQDVAFHYGFIFRLGLKIYASTQGCVVF